MPTTIDAVQWDQADTMFEKDSRGPPRGTGTTTAGLKQGLEWGVRTPVLS